MGGRGDQPLRAQRLERKIACSERVQVDANTLPLLRDLRGMGGQSTYRLAHMGPKNCPQACLMHAGSIEQAEDALILFDLAAIFAVVTRNADCSHHRGFLAPDTGAGDCGARGELARAAQLAELDA